MSYIVVKTIKGRRYRYLQTSWREGKRVRTKSVCLGALDSAGGSFGSCVAGGRSGSIKTRRTAQERALAVAERHAALVEKDQRDRFGETAAERVGRERQEHLDNLHERFGLTVGPSHPTPTEANVGAPACAETENSSEAGTDADGDASGLG